MAVLASTPMALTRGVPVFDRIAPVATAAVLGACLAAAGGLTPLPGLAVAAFVLLVAERDMRHRRIPNALTFPAFGLALVYAAASSGLEGLLLALAGAAAVLVVLFAPFAMRVLGAGDVKAMLVIGAVVGPTLILEVLFWITLAAGAMGIAMLVLRGGALELLRRWKHIAMLSLLSRRPRYIAPDSGDVAAAGLPFGVAIGFGLAACQTWGTTCL